jgi:hypothetical protein
VFVDGNREAAAFRTSELFLVRSAPPMPWKKRTLD